MKEKFDDWKMIWHRAVNWSDTKQAFSHSKCLFFFFPYLLISSHLIVCIFLFEWRMNEQSFITSKAKSSVSLGVFEYNMKNMKRWIFLDVASFTKLLCQLEEIFTTLITLHFHNFISNSRNHNCMINHNKKLWLIGWDT